MPIDPTKFDALIADDTSRTARDAATVTPAVSPDDMARAKRHADELGLPPLVVADHLPEYDEQQRVARIGKVAAENPKLGTFMATPERAKLIEDDVDTTDLLSRAIQNLVPWQGAQEFLTAPIRGLRRSDGANTAKAGTLYAAGATAEFAADWLDRMNPLAPLVEAMPVKATNAEGERALRSMADPLGFRDIGDAARAINADSRAELAYSGDKVGTLPTAQDWLANPAAALEQATARLTNQAAASAPLMAVGVAARNPTLGALVLGIPTGGQTYSDLREQGVDMDTATAAGLATGAMEFAGEKLGLEALLLPSWKKALVVGPATEYGQEFVTQLGQEGVENVASGRPLHAGQMLTHAHEAGLVGGFMGGGIAAGRAVSAPVVDAYAARAATRSKQRAAAMTGELHRFATSAENVARLDALTELGGKFKLGERSPEEAEAFVAHMGGGEQSVFIPAGEFRVLFQEGADALADQLTGETGALAAAGEHGDIAIPLPKYVSTLARMANASEIAAVARLDAEGLSRKELESTDFDAEISEIEGAEGTKESDAHATEVGDIETGLFAALQATGRYKDNDAALQAKVTARVFGTLAKRTGLSPRELFGRYNLSINGHSTTGYTAGHERTDQHPEGARSSEVRDGDGVRGGAGVLAQPLRSDARGRDGDGSLGGLPRILSPGGRPAGHFGAAGTLARSIVEARGDVYTPPSLYARVNPELAAQIAREYEAMAHAPQDPEVAAAYAAMIEETALQFQAMLDAGVVIEFITARDEAGDLVDPYLSNPRALMDDLRDNNHLFVFSTRDGFGSDATFDVSENPLLAETAFTDASGRPMLANDVFRAVHDYFGHAKEGVGFRADGEENAWRAHGAMYSPLARRAMTTETRGQNSWLNFGPHGEHNRTASSTETVYAVQKVGLLPAWVSEEGRTDRVVLDQLAPMDPYAFALWFGDSKVVDANGNPIVVYHGTAAQFDRFAYASGSTTGHPSAAFGYYFATTRDVAESYADQAAMNADVDEGHVIDAYLSIRNPYVMTQEEWEAPADHGEALAMREWMERQGYDGIHIVDADFWVAFHPTQIKSASRNSGAFDPTNASILFQHAARNGLGLWSAAQQAIIDMKLPGWKTPTGLVSGTEIWHKLKSTPGVKAEELKWAGIEEALTGERIAIWELRDEAGRVLAHSGEDNPGEASPGESWTRRKAGVPKFSRAEVLEILVLDGAVNVQLVQAGGVPRDLEWTLTINTEGDLDFQLSSQNAGNVFVDEKRAMRTGKAEWFDWDAWWENNATVYAGAIGLDTEETINPETGERLTLDEVVMLAAPLAMLNEHARLVAAHGAESEAASGYTRALRSAVIADLFDAGFTRDGLLKPALDKRIRERYGDVEVRTAGDWQIIGNYVTGYVLYHKGDSIMQSLVLDTVLQKARQEAGGVRSNTKWSGYIAKDRNSGPTHYRELKLTLPDNPGEKFTYNTHFPEANIVAYTRVTDRSIVIDPTQAPSPEPVADLPMPDDYNAVGAEHGMNAGEIRRDIAALQANVDEMQATLATRTADGENTANTRRILEGYRTELDVANEELAELEKQWALDPRSRRSTPMPDDFAFGGHYASRLRGYIAQDEADLAEAEATGDEQLARRERRLLADNKRALADLQAAWDQLTTGPVPGMPEDFLAPGNMDVVSDIRTHLMRTESWLADANVSGYLDTELAEKALAHYRAELANAEAAWPDAYRADPSLLMPDDFRDHDTTTKTAGYLRRQVREAQESVDKMQAWVNGPDMMPLDPAWSPAASFRTLDQLDDLRGDLANGEDHGWVTRDELDKQEGELRDEWAKVFTQTADDLLAQAKGALQEVRNAWIEKRVAELRYEVASNPRVDAYFIEELQSDWHQRGRREGYRAAEEGTDQYAMTEDDYAELIDKAADEIHDVHLGWASTMTPEQRHTRDVVNASLAAVGFHDLTYQEDATLYEVRRAHMSPDGEVWPKFAAALRAEGKHELLAKFEHYIEMKGRLVALRQRRHDQEKTVPDAPFKDDAWTNLALKHALVEAVNQGKTAFAWTDSNSQVTLWNEDYRELYENTYDKRMVSAVRKLTGVAPVRFHWNGTPYDAMRTVLGRGTRVQEIDARMSAIEAELRELPGFPHDGDPNAQAEFIQASGAASAQIAETRELQEERETLLANRTMAPDGYWSIEITPELRAQILDKSFPLFQPAEGGAKPGPQGQIDIGRRSDMAITLFDSANLSTFMHEASHLFLEVLSDLAADPNAPQQIRDDFAEIRKFTGVQPGEAIEAQHHERFARSFELYLRTGKAPAPELTSAFARFRRWLSSVYRDMQQLIAAGAKQLNPEITAVFDRLLATDEEIELASTRQGHIPMMTREQFGELGLSDNAWENYVAMLEAATDEARAEVTAEVLAAQQREQRAGWKAEADLVKAELLAAMEASPPFVTWRALQASEAKLDLDAINRDYTEAERKTIRGLRVARKTGGVDPDLAAVTYGYPSGDALIRALLMVRKMQAGLDPAVAEVMQQRHPDPVESPGALQDAVTKALYRSKRVAALEAELALLARLAGQQAPNARVLRAIAAQTIARLTTRKLQPGAYLTAERKAARAAMQAAAKGDYAAALAAKRDQTMQAMLYSEARAAKDRAEAQIRALRKAGSPETLQRIGKAGKEYVEALTALLAGHELTAVSGKAIERRAALRAWVARMQDDDNDTAVSEELLARVEAERVTNVADLSMQQLADLHEAVKNLLHLARLKNEIVTKRGKLEWEAAKAELLARLRDTLDPAKPLPISDADRTFLDRLSGLYHGALDWVLQPETVIEWLDGGESGPWHDVLWTMAEEAQHHRERLNRKVGTLLQPAFDALSKADLRDLNKRVHIVSLGRSVSKQTILSALLNMGNAGNRDKLLRGGMMIDGVIVEFTEEQLAEMFQHLSAKHARMVQTIWDAINDGLWPEIVKMQEDVAGIAPEKVEATPFTVRTKDGPVPLRGGYYPVAYDPTKSRAGAKSEEEQAKRALGGQAPTRATTSKGHIEKRTAYAAPLLLDYHSVLTGHVDDVISDITHRRFLQQVFRVMGDEEISGVIAERLTPATVRILRQGLERGAVGIKPLAGPLFGPFQNVANATMTNVAAAALGLRVPLMLANVVTSPILATARVKKRWLLRGFASYYANPAKATRAIHALSPMMEARAKAHDTDTAQMLATLRGKVTLRKRMIELTMGIHRWIVPLSERAIWLARYMQAQAGGDSIEESARVADIAVRQTQTKHTAKDLSNAEANPYLKLMMLFAGPLVVINNRLQESGLRGSKRGAVHSNMQALATWLAMAGGGFFLFELVMGRGPGDEDDDDDIDLADWTIWTARKLALMPFQSMPVLRDAAGYIDGGYSRPNPLVDAGNGLVRFGKEAWDAAESIVTDEEIDTDALAKATLNAAGTVTGVPSNQARRTGTYLIEVGTGQHTPQSPADAVYIMQGIPKDADK